MKTILRIGGTGNLGALGTLMNDRYPGIRPTRVREYAATLRS